MFTIRTLQLFILEPSKVAIMFSPVLDFLGQSTIFVFLFFQCLVLLSNL